MRNVNFNFLDGAYYHFNDKIYQYNDLEKFKDIVDGLVVYLVKDVSQDRNIVKSINAFREILFSMIDTLAQSDPISIDKIIKKYFKAVTLEFQELINEFDQDPDTHKLELNVNRINNQLIKIVLNDFLESDGRDFILFMANRSSSFKSEYINSLKMNKFLNDELQNLKINLKNSNNNKSAVDLYDEINKDFLKLEKKYRWLFISTLFTTLILTIGYDPLTGIGGNLYSMGCSLNSKWFDGCSTLLAPDLYPFNGNTLKFIMFKLTVLIVGITLTTYFLKISGFYQLKQEQAKQTKLELSAFPDFVSGMDPSISNNLRQELALKYFGKEIDKTGIEKNENLVQEQVKAGTELIKASAEMVKTLKTFGINVDKTTTIKPNNTSTEG